MVVSVARHLGGRLAQERWHALIPNRARSGWRRRRGGGRRCRCGCGCRWRCGSIAFGVAACDSNAWLVPDVVRNAGGLGGCHRGCRRGGPGFPMVVVSSLVSSGDDRSGCRQGRTPQRPRVAAIWRGPPEVAKVFLAAATRNLRPLDSPRRDIATISSFGGPANPGGPSGFASPPYDGFAFIGELISITHVEIPG